MTLNDTITAAVANELEHRGMSQSALARSLGRSPSWVSRLLKGTIRWTADDMDAVAGALGLTPVWLLSHVTRGIRVLRILFPTRNKTVPARLAVAA